MRHSCLGHKVCWNRSLQLHSEQGTRLSDQSMHCCCWLGKRNLRHHKFEHLGTMEICQSDTHPNRRSSYLSHLLAIGTARLRSSSVPRQRNASTSIPMTAKSRTASARSLAMRSMVCVRLEMSACQTTVKMRAVPIARR